MGVINIDNIPLVEDSVEFCQDKILPYLRTILPSHKMFLAEESFPVPTEPYLTLRFITQRGDNEGELGNSPVYKETDDIGGTTEIFEYLNVFELRIYKGNAYGELSKVKQSLKNKRLWYEYFGSSDEIGVRATTPVTNTATPIDLQEWETGASMNITLSCLTKEIDEGLSYITTVDYTAEIKDENKDTLDQKSDSVTYPEP